MRKDFLKEGCTYPIYGEDCINEKGREIIISDVDFQEGLEEECITEETMNDLAKEFGCWDDEDDYVAFCQNLVIIAMEETGKEWFWSECLFVVKED